MRIKNPGAIPEPTDIRDHRLEEIEPAFGAAPIDWHKGYDIEEIMGRQLPTKEQGKAGSCVSMAWSYYSEVLDYLESKSFLRQSARFIYSKIFLPQGGAYIRDGGNVLVKDGEVPETIIRDKLTEQEMRYSGDITPYILTIAKTLLKSSYASFWAKTIDDMASVIKTHYGAVFGVLDDFKWSNWKGEIVKMGSGNSGHCLYAGKFKLINGKKYIGVKNSWGNRTGKNGWQWLGEEWFLKNRTFNPKTIIDLPNEVERPKKKPTHYFLNNLKVGAKNSEVMALQECLRYLGLFNYPKSTGYFGGITLRAVKAFQLLNKVPATGFVGPMTRKELNKKFGF